MNKATEKLMGPAVCDDDTVKPTFRQEAGHEAGSIRSATDRVRRERTDIESKNASLRRLIRREEALVRRLERILSETTRERAAIQAELASILKEAAGMAAR